MLIILPDGHHSESDVVWRHVVRALDFVDLVAFGHDNAVMLQHDGVGEHAVHRLRVAITAVHRQIQAEGVAVLHVDVARFTAAQRVNAAAERTVRLDQHFDFRITAVYSH